MAEFNVIIAKEKSSSDLAPIGNAIIELSKLKDTDSVLGDADIGICTTSALEKFQNQNFDEASQKWVDEIFDSLSVEIFPPAVNEGITLFSEHGSGAKIKSDVKLIFVFEDDDSMIVPIPSKKQLERGLELAPLMQPTIYSQVNGVAIANDFVGHIEQKASVGGSPINKLKLDHPDLYEAVITEIHGKGGELKDDADENAVGIFYQQLADYSMRQCAH